MKIYLFIILALASLCSHAAYTGGQVPSNMYGAGTIRFGISNPPSDTCDYHGRHFKFDATTEAGKNMLSILLAAKLSGENINVWYTPSSAPGTNEGTGCSDSTIAVVTSIGIN